MILAGSLEVRRDPRVESILGLVVADVDVVGLCEARRSRVQGERGVSPAVLSARVGLGKRSLERWAREGLMASTSTETGRPRVTPTAVEQFSQQYVTAGEAAELLGLTRMALYGSIKNDEVQPTTRVGGGRKWLLFSRVEIDRLKAVPHMAVETAAARLGLSATLLLGRARRNGIRCRVSTDDGHERVLVPVSFVDQLIAGVANVRSLPRPRTESS